LTKTARKPEGILDHTIAFWQPHYRQELTREDAREIIENTAGFFKILAEWDRKVREDNRLRKQEPTEQEREVSARGDLVSDSVFGG